MRKWIALWRNELEKNIRRPMFFILLAAMLAGTLGVGLLSWRQVTRFSGYELGSRWPEYQQQLSDIETYGGFVKPDLPEEEADRAKRSVEAQKEALRFLIDNRVPERSQAPHLAMLVDALISAKIELAGLEDPTVENKTPEEADRINKTRLAVVALQNALRDGSLASSISVMKTALTLGDSLEMSRLRQEGLDLLAGMPVVDGKPDPSLYLSLMYDMENWIQSSQSLEYGLDMQASPMPMPLTPARRTELQNRQAITRYRLTHGLGGQNQIAQYQALSQTSSFGLFFLIIIAMILGGSSVAQEMATGSIKSLIISPTRRWKIFIAKYVALITLTAGLAIVLWLWLLLLGGPLFGLGIGQTQVLATSGQAFPISGVWRLLLTLGFDLIEVVFYLTLALTLSVITRNSAISVALPLGFYLGGTIVNLVLSSMRLLTETIKFLPFRHFSLFARVFAEDTVQFGVPSSAYPPVSFSIAYIAVVLLCLGYIAFDSFTRRDI